MKRSIKFISVFSAIVLLFSSCGKVTPGKITDKMTSYFEKNDYQTCKTYLSSIDSDTKRQASDEALKLTENEFSEIYKKYESYNFFDITLFDETFTNNCVKLWEIASEFTPNEDAASNESLQYLRYFSVSSDAMRYKELFRMIKDMYSSGYLYSIEKSLNDYDTSGEYAYFETAEKIASEFNYSDYNPQEYYISEMRSVCEKMNKYLISVNNGFATNDTAVVAAAINNIYTTADTLLFACDSVQTVYTAMNEAMNTFRIQGAFTEYKNQINFSEPRKYTAGTSFQLSNIFGGTYTPPDISDSNVTDENESQTSVSKKEAVKIAVNAINKTKAYNSEITINKTQTVDIQMTSFKTDSEITSAVSLVRMRINDTLKKYNGTSRESKEFVKGECEGIKLYNSIPPSESSASLDPSFVESFTAVKGNGGYVITFTLSSCTSTDDNISRNLLSMVDGFYFDNGIQNIKYKTFYKPTSISLVVNNSGYLAKYAYNISGIADCRFTENGEQVATGEFSFSQQYGYDFVY